MSARKSNAKIRDAEENEQAKRHIQMLRERQKKAEETLKRLEEATGKQEELRKKSEQVQSLLNAEKEVLVDIVDKEHKYLDKAAEEAKLLLEKKRELQERLAKLSTSSRDKEDELYKLKYQKDDVESKAEKMQHDLEKLKKQQEQAIAEKRAKEEELRRLNDDVVGQRSNVQDLRSQKRYNY